MTALDKPQGDYCKVCGVGPAGAHWKGCPNEPLCSSNTRWY